MTTSDPTPHQPRPKSGCLSAIMVVVGLVLLLPGLCSLLTAMILVGSLVKSDLSGPINGGDFLVTIGPWLMVWVIGLLIGYLGIRLISRATS